MKDQHYKNYSLENINDEMWQDVAELEGHYQISNFGRVKSLARKVWSQKQQCYYPIKERILRQTKCLDHVKVRLRSRELEIDRTALPSQLVADAFLKKERDQFVFHKNIDFTNNHISNLELGDKNNYSEVQKKIKLKYAPSKKSKRINSHPSFYKGVHKQDFYVMTIASKEHNLHKTETFATEEEAARRYDYYIKKFNLKRKGNFIIN